MYRTICGRLFLSCLTLFCTMQMKIRAESESSQAKLELEMVYKNNLHQSDINEHLYLLRGLAAESSSVVEIGLRTMVSSWGLLLGLAESPFQNVSYIGIDLNSPPLETLNYAKRIAEANQISFQFIQANDMEIEIDPVDTLFIDSLHTYCHLTYELEKFSPMVEKYIAMHDTSEPWGDRDDSVYYGDRSEYSLDIDRNKRGLWEAVVDFLNRHPEWSLKARYLNNHGFTILERISPR